MPKITQSPPKYRKHKASGQAVVALAGGDHYLGPHGTKTSKQERDRLVPEWLACSRVDIVADNAPAITISEVLLAFWRFAQGWYVKNGEPTNEIKAYRLILRDVRELYGATSAADFGPLTFKAVRQRWIDRGQARSTVNKNAGLLKRRFKWAVSEELLPASVHRPPSTVHRGRPPQRANRCQGIQADPAGGTRGCRSGDPALAVGHR